MYQLFNTSRYVSTFDLREICKIKNKMQTMISAKSNVHRLVPGENKGFAQAFWLVNVWDGTHIQDFHFKVHLLFPYIPDPIPQNECYLLHMCNCEYTSVVCVCTRAPPWHRALLRTSKDHCDEVTLWQWASTLPGERDRHSSLWLRKANRHWFFILSLL